VKGIIHTSVDANEEEKTRRKNEGVKTATTESRTKPENQHPTSQTCSQSRILSISQKERLKGRPRKYHL